MHCESSNHAPATYQMNTGAILGGKPSMGSWLTYGLGSENQNLPGYVLLFRVGGLGGPANWSNAFLPAAFQGTRFSYQGNPVLNLSPPDSFAGTQRSTLDTIQSLNRSHAAVHPGEGDLDGRIAAYELAYRMQAEALDVGDLKDETQATLEMYGVNDSNRDLDMYARQCLLARRLVERGVRVVQTYHAVDKLGWDGHEKNADNHSTQAAFTDKPIGALLKDLKQRGLLDTTLVIWAGEFGRTPMAQGGERAQSQSLRLQRLVSRWWCERRPIDWRYGRNRPQGYRRPSPGKGSSRDNPACHGPSTRRTVLRTQWPSRTPYGRRRQRQDY